MHHHHRGLSAIFLAAALVPLPSLAVAATVQLTGRVNETCAFTDTGNGTLVVSAPDARSMNSTASGGASATLGVGANGNYRVTLDQETLIAHPDDHDGNAAITISTTGAQGYAASPREVDIAPGRHIIDVDVQLTDGDPLAPGTYTVQVTATCAPRN